MNDDENFLAELLDGYEPLELSIKQQHDDIAPDQHSDQILAETEALLASIEDPVVSSESKVKAAKRRLKYVNKIKDERKTLEEEEKMLSEQLSHLQHARKKAKLLRDKSSAVPVWKALATRQMEGRLVAEEQHRRLKHAVENRAKVIEEIGEMVRKRLKKTGQENLAIQQSNKLSPDDTALFEEFLHDLDMIYARTDEVFRACRVEEMPHMSYTLGPERKWDGDMEYIDKLDVLFVPFSFDETCRTMWQSMRHVNQQKDRHHYGHAADPDNTVAVKQRLRAMRDSGGPVDMLVHFVMRRYVESGRMIVVWRALSQGEEEFSRMHSDETGWCVVRPNDAEVEDSSLMRTVIQTFVRFVPMTVSPDNTSDAMDGFQFTKLVVTSVEEEADEVARLMDSLLLDDSRAINTKLTRDHER